MDIYDLAAIVLLTKAKLAEQLELFFPLFLLD